MQKYIYDKLYDTDDSEKIHSWKKPDEQDGNQHITLYRTKSGEWFLHYHQDETLEIKNLEANEDIAVINDDEARQYLKDKGGVDTFRRVFPDEYELPG